MSGMQEAGNPREYAAAHQGDARTNLIERAAKAIWIERNAGADIGWGESAWAELTSPDDWNQEALDALEEARAALAVFGKFVTDASLTLTHDHSPAASVSEVQASAPTGDDREALLAEADALVESWDRRGSWDADSPVGMVMRLAAALRSEVPEPSAEPCCRHCMKGDGTRTADCTGDEDAHLTPCRHCATAEQHAEPSEEHMDALTRIDQAVAYIRGSWLGRGEPTPNTPAGEIIAILRGIRTFTPEPQGEPSDAEVIGALKAYYGEPHGDWISQFAPNMRAAIRAAAAVRGTGGEQ